MDKKLVVKTVLFGLLSWAIPFGISFLFYKPSGELVVEFATFKSTITVIGNLSGCYLLYKYLKHVDRNFIKNSVIVGLSWFAINIILDSLVLIPMMKSTFINYFMTIGISYFSIPTISITMGCLLNRRTNV